MVDATKWYDCPHCDAGYPDQKCICKENKEQKAYQTARDWWYVFAGFIIGGIPAFILGFELAK